MERSSLFLGEYYGVFSAFLQSKTGAGPLNGPIVFWAERNLHLLAQIMSDLTVMVGRRGVHP